MVTFLVWIKAVRVYNYSVTARMSWQIIESAQQYTALMMILQSRLLRCGTPVQRPGLVPPGTRRTASWWVPTLVGLTRRSTLASIHALSAGRPMSSSRQPLLLTIPPLPPNMRERDEGFTRIARETVEIPTLPQLIWMVIFTLIIEDVDLNWNWKWKLEFPYVGKHPLQSLYTEYYHTLWISCALHSGGACRSWVTINLRRNTLLQKKQRDWCVQRWKWLINHLIGVWQFKMWK